LENQLSELGRSLHVDRRLDEESRSLEMGAPSHSANDQSALPGNRTEIPGDQINHQVDFTNVETGCPTFSKTEGCIGGRTEARFSPDRNCINRRDREDPGVDARNDELDSSTTMGKEQTSRTQCRCGCLEVCDGKSLRDDSTLSDSQIKVHGDDYCHQKPSESTREQEELIQITSHHDIGNRLGRSLSHSNDGGSNQDVLAELPQKTHGPPEICKDLDKAPELGKTGHDQS
jgi:hypothetical protein